MNRTDKPSKREGYVAVLVWVLAWWIFASCGQSEEAAPVSPTAQKRDAAVRVRVFPAVTEALDDRVELTGVAAHVECPAEILQARLAEVGPQEGFPYEDFCRSVEQRLEREPPVACSGTIEI